jgi:uncharacterized protein
MDYRVGCGACCIAPSISSPMPGMPHGKTSGVRCMNLTHDHRCALYGKPERPEVCKRLRASEEMCGQTAREAFVWLAWMERATQRGRRSLASHCCIDYHTGGRYTLCPTANNLLVN